MPSISRRNSSINLLCGLLVLAAPACAHSPGSAPTAPLAAAPEQTLANNTPTQTAAGITFTAPAGWVLKGSPEQRVLTFGSDLTVVITDPVKGDADAAVLAAWKALHPNFDRKVLLSQTIPARDGWDELKTYTYEISPNERLTLTALAFRRGDGWMVFQVEASDMAFERRGAQIGLIRQSVRPPGYQRESFAGKKANTLDAARIKLLTDFVQEAQAKAGIPGVGLALIQDNRIIFEGGFGTRELGKQAPVDANTLFMIASNTKPLSTLLLATLVDGGKFTWETPVTKIFPSFKLGDDDITRQVLMKHLVCACTGLPRQDLEWLFEFKNATAASELALLGTMKPTTGFGETFQYSNLLASAAGYTGSHVLFPEVELGAAYDKAMSERVFKPLSMNNTTFDFATVLRSDHASPHSEDMEGNVQPASMDIDYSIVPLRPAGGAWSSAHDLAQYVLMELANGKLPDGKTYMQDSVLLARRSPQVAAGADSTYGMGLFVNTRPGVPVVRHGGSMIGFKSDMFWLPENGIGAVVLTNSDSGQLLLGAFLRRLLEVSFDGRPEAVEDLSTAAVRRKELFTKGREKMVIPADPVVVARLAKAYSNPALGRLDVRTEGKQTLFDLGEWHGEIASQQNEDGSISLVTISPGITGFEFVLEDKNGSTQLTIRDMQHEYVFTPVP